VRRLLQRLLPRSPGRRAAAAGVLVVLVGAGVGVYLYAHRRPGSVYHPHARFVPQPAPSLPTRGPDRFAWPFYGYTKNHTRFFPAPPRVHPPFKRRWAHAVGSLLEFPGVIQGERIFQLADNATLNATNKHTGRVMWSHRLGSLSASAPAVIGGTVYATVLLPGRLVALDVARGRVRWSRRISSRTESSPMVDGGKVFIGSESGTVYALDARTGNVVWTYHAAGAVKASPTLSGGVLYFGDYSGHVQAISERTGRRLWVSGSGGGLLGSGNFYSTAAVVYGRVFLGNTDGRMYAYDAGSGALDWAVQTGAYVYASPAVTNAPGLGPTVYVGSYDGTFYAFNARSGRVAWSYHAGGAISGSATIIGRTVYFADLRDHSTHGLGISTGRPVFRFPSGKFDPVISDGVDIYLTGTTGLYALSPR